MKLEYTQQQKSKSEWINKAANGANFNMYKIAADNKGEHKEKYHKQKFFEGQENDWYSSTVFMEK